jgi:hypothetical protein
VSIEKVVMMNDTSAVCHNGLLPVSQNRMTDTAADVQCPEKVLPREEE